MARDEELRTDPACERCGAPIPDPRQGVQEGVHLFCCPNCSAAGVRAEPLPEA